jgi:hypothetical protein
MIDSFTGDGASGFRVSATDRCRPAISATEGTDRG